MGGRGSRSRLNPFVANPAVPPQQPPQVQQMQQPLQGPALQQNAVDDDDFHIATTQDEAAIMAVNAAYDRTMRQAQRDYIDPNPQANGYGFAQNLNHDLVQNGPTGLTGRELQVYNTIMQNMAPLGANLILNRATHDGWQGWGSYTDGAGYRRSGCSRALGSGDHG